MNKLGKAIFETRLEAEISELFGNINVTARTIKDQLKKQKSDILIDTPEKDKQDDELGGIDDILDQSKQTDHVQLDQTVKSLNVKLDKSMNDKLDSLDTSVVSVIKVDGDYAADDSLDQKKTKESTKILDDSIISVD